MKLASHIFLGLLDFSSLLPLFVATTHWLCCCENTYRTSFSLLFAGLVVEGLPSHLSLLFICLELFVCDIRPGHFISNTCSLRYLCVCVQRVGPTLYISITSIMISNGLLLVAVEMLLVSYNIISFSLVMSAVTSPIIALISS